MEPDYSQFRRERREAREEWCATRRVGDHTATFYPGDDLRCPGTRVFPSGAKQPCGAWLDGFMPATDSKVVVRARPHRYDVRAGPGLDKRCRDCGCTLEIRPILEATG